MTGVRLRRPARRRSAAAGVGGAVGGAAVLVAALGVAAQAFWSTTAAGTGTARAGTAVAVVLTGGTVSTPLFPGGTGDVAVTVTNPNSFPVLLTGLALTAGKTVTSGAAGNACDTGGNGVSLVPPTTAVRIAAGAANVRVDYPGAAAMAVTATNACQGQTFTIPLSGTATATS